MRGWWQSRVAAVGRGVANNSCPTFAGTRRIFTAARTRVLRRSMVRLLGRRASPAPIPPGATTARPLSEWQDDRVTRDRPKEVGQNPFQNAPPEQSGLPTTEHGSRSYQLTQIRQSTPTGQVQVYYIPLAPRDHGAQT